MESDSLSQPPVDGDEPAAPAPPLSTSQNLQKYDNAWLILGVLFGVTGVMGLPLLWISNKFSLLMKIVWSIVVTVYTGVLIAAVCWIVVWTWRRVAESL